MSYRTVVQLAKAIAEPLVPSKVRTAFLAAIATEDWDAIRKLKADPNSYSPDELECYRNDAQITALLRKLDVLPSNVDTKQVAIDKFLQGERKCYQTNNFFCRTLESPAQDLSPFEEAFRRRAFKARGWLKEVLGPLPDFLDGRFGPGNVYEADAWSETHLFAKFVYQPTYTGNFSPALRRILVEDTPWGRAQLLLGSPHAPVGRQVKGSRLTTVPKNGDEDRAITIGCGMNLFAQLGVGSALKRRINRLGCRSTPGTGRRGAPYWDRYLDGQQLHKLLAQEGSVTGRWVTEDLRNASNHNALKAVRFLFSEWGEVMNELREPCTDIPGLGTLRLQMFSAMGNGFTFEVLTLMMLAIAYASGFTPGVDAFAYGDDVILANDERVQDFNALLACFGHEINHEKSFVDGPFRESCGGDYWMGRDVRPVFIDEVPSSPIEWMELHNHLLTKGFLTDDAAKIIRRQIEPKHRLFGPPGIQGVLWSERNWSFPSKTKEKSDFNAVGLHLADRYQTPVIKRVTAIPRKASLFPAAREPQIVALLGAMGLPWRDLAIRKNGKDEISHYEVDWVAIPGKEPSLSKSVLARKRTWWDITERIASSLVKPRVAVM